MKDGRQGAKKKVDGAIRMIRIAPPDKESGLTGESAASGSRTPS